MGLEAGLFGPCTRGNQRPELIGCVGVLTHTASHTYAAPENQASHLCRAPREGEGMPSEVLRIGLVSEALWHSGAGAMEFSASSRAAPCAARTYVSVVRHFFARLSLHIDFST